MNKIKKNKRKSEGHKARLVANDYNKKVDCDKVFIPSNSPGYHKARQTTIGTQGEKKRRLGGYQVKE